MRCAIFLRTNFIEEVRRRAGEEGREEGREVLNSSVRIVDKIYEAGGYGLSGPCTSESGHRLDSGSPFWRIQLDQDLLDTISAIYPEWFKDYTNSRTASTSSPTSASASGAQSCNDSTAVVVVTGGEAKVVKGDAKSKSKAKKADGHKDKDRDRKDPRRDAKDERDAGNGKKGTKPSPQQDKAAADAAGRKAASAVPGSESKMAEGNQSPPKAEVDDSPLQHAMDRNKESARIIASQPGLQVHDVPLPDLIIRPHSLVTTLKSPPTANYATVKTAFFIAPCKWPLYATQLPDFRESADNSSGDNDGDIN
ncbi:hypothetical protein ALC56_09566 [Trachymyrmex septentrionalis]|uniref:Uncharacterized protein n=1 Tax=Trachymyrmex septentrionalis TaxID=34720 RepID=A0A195F613_9HYME|nr:hypothetical protein ALC56_09566 [Trachymyrmex septentrionalis]